MGNAEFLVLMAENVWLFGVCVFTALIIYFMIFRKLWVSILDPIVLAWLGSCMGFAVVLFLYFTDSILGVYLWSYLITQAAFIIGFFFFYKGRVKISLPALRIKDAAQVARHIFIGATLIDVMAQLSSYALVGIPMFLDSRLDIMKDAGGAGILTRVYDVCRIFSVIMAFYYLRKGNSTRLLRRYVILYLLYLATVVVLSGSRSALLGTFGGAFFLFAYSYRKVYPKMMMVLKKYEWRFIMIGALLAVGMMALKDGGLLNGFFTIAFRLVAYGDTYWYAYPNELIENIDDSSPFLSLFSSFLGSFRIVPYSELPRSIGMDLFAQLSSADVVGGPNARHNVFGYLYFGIAGGAVFSFLLGGMLGYIRRMFFQNKAKSILAVVFISWLYVASCSIETDPNFFIFQLNSFVMAAPLVFMMGVLSFVACKLFISHGK